MEIYLIRHTTPDVGKGVCYGLTDLSLKDTFESEAKEVLEQLPDHFDKVYSSPLIRCHQLAKKIVAEPVLDDRLKEMNFGEWEMQIWDEIPKSEIQPWFDDWVNEYAKGGESYLDVYKRSIDFLSSILGDYKKGKIAIVAHAGIIRAMNAYFNKVELKDSFGVKLEYGGVIKITL